MYDSWFLKGSTEMGELVEEEGDLEDMEEEAEDDEDEDELEMDSDSDSDTMFDNMSLKGNFFR